MSRRKQARPRLIKREDEEDTEGQSDADETQEVKKMKLSDDEELQNGTDGSEKKGEDTPECEIFRCESCGTKFEDLARFMDHKNAQCENGEGTVKLENSSRSETPLSQPSTGSNGYHTVESPLPDIEPDKVPHSTEVDEQHPVACQYCDKAFAKRSFLLVHEQVHADVLPFSCGYCSRVFKTKKLMEKHEKGHLQSDKQFKCDHCSSSFAKFEHLRSHMRAHETNESYPCQTCSLEYPTMAALMSHQNAHKPKLHNAKQYHSCSDCGDVFFTVTEKDTHVCSETGAKRTFQCKHCAAICVGPTALALHNEHAHAGTGTEQNKCPLCNKCFLSLDELTAHMKVHEMTSFERKLYSETGNLQNLEFTAGFLGGSTVTCPSDILVCPYCLKDDFETLESLELHMQSVHSVKPTEVYTCNYCNAPYKNLYSLHEHMRAIHQNQPSMGIKYPCSRCGKEYPSIESLQEHKKKMHYKPKHPENLISCNECGLSFASSSSLSEHIILVHGDRKPNDTTKTRAPPSYQSHMSQRLASESKSGEYYYHFNDSPTIINVPEPSQLLRRLKSPVKSVGKTIPTVSSPTGTVHHGAGLSRRHSQSSHSSSVSGSHSVTSPTRSPSGSREERIQEKITCDHCNAKFVDMAGYQAHISLHLDSSLGQYSCRQCDKIFLSEEQLESHLSLHYLSATSEYGCDSCNKMFQKPDELQKHLMDIHAHHLYKCSLCKEVFDSKVNIQVHFAIKHSNETKLYRCVVCDTVCRSDTEWQIHLRVTHLNMSKPYRCLFCKESFGSEMDLQCHLATHNKPFKCSMCDEMFLVEFLLDKHIQNVHSAPSTHSGSPNSRTQSPKPNGDKVEKETKLCIKQENGVGANPTLFHTLLSTSNHSPILTAGSASILGDGNQLYHSISSGLLGDVVTGLYQGLSPGSTGSGGSLVWKSPEDLYRCNICDVKFNQLASLQNHKLQDHGLKYASGKYSPSSSPKESDRSNGDNSPGITSSHLDPETSISSTGRRSSLLESALTSSLMIPAGLSADTLINVDNLNDKLSSSFGEKICLACPFCSQTFKCKADLEKHGKIHLNTGSQKCNICDEVFASSGILAEHKLTHCKIQQGNICVACKIPIRSEEQFYIHSQEHGFQGAVMQCIVCRQTLASMLELQMHGRHHFQSKSAFHTCCVCLNSFESSDNLVSKLNSSGRTYYVCKPCYQGSSSDFQCSQCSAKFTSKSGLELHEMSHKKSYQCIKCQESFASEFEIQMHVATHMITEGNVHECFLCCVILDSPAKLQCHLIEHTFKNADYKCENCGRVFISAGDIQAHALEHGVASRRYSCNQCPQRFFFSAELENHRYLHKLKAEQYAKSSPSNNKSLTIQPLDHFSFHQSSVSPKSPYNVSNTGSFKQRTDEGFNCSKCDEKYSDLFDLANHYKECHPDNQKKQHVCPNCPEAFASVIQMQAHFFTRHTVKEPEKTKPKHVCMECGKECSSEHNLLTHMNTHRKGKKVSCPNCSRQFSTSMGLTSHMAHCGQKPHECPICHKRFSKKSNKMEHMKIHSGDKVYPCTTCGKLFSGKAALEEHAKIHQGSSMEDENQTESRSGTSEETRASAGNTSDDDDGVGMSISDGETGDMKQEVTSTSNIDDSVETSK